jgi:chaperonin GroEL (HSP60 family)
MIVRRAIKNAKIVPGGGAIEMELSKHIRDHAHRIFGMYFPASNFYLLKLTISQENSS